MKSKDSSGKDKALKIFSNEYDSCLENKAGERSAFKTKSFNSRAVDGRYSRVKYIKEERVKKNVFLSTFFLNTKTTLVDQLHNVFCP